MKRYKSALYGSVENERIDRFLLEVVEVCRKHHLSIGHEDDHGAFQVGNLEESDLRWLLNANDMTPLAGTPREARVRAARLVPKTLADGTIGMFDPWTGQRYDTSTGEGVLGLRGGQSDT